MGVLFVKGVLHDEFGRDNSTRNWLIPSAKISGFSSSTR
jgi:hypothetical protein